MTTNLLLNPWFVEQWDGSHSCLRINQSGVLSTVEVPNVFTPPHWLVWFRYSANFAQPEGRDTWAEVHPERVKVGEKAYLLFTFSRRHDCGLLQQVDVTPGTVLKFSAWPHAWSNHKDVNRPDDFPHPDDPEWSEGAGYEHTYWRNDLLSLTGDPQSDARKNFSFYVGIDATGDTDPYGSTVAWSPAWSVYNGYVYQPSIAVEALSHKVTVFLRSSTLWPFKHNDAYWDDARLEAIEEEPCECRGLPRVQYARTYHVVPATVSLDRAVEIFREVWEDNPATVGPSFDDAGLGDLDDKHAVVWDQDEEKHPSIDAFFEEHYSGTGTEFQGDVGPDTPVAPFMLPTYHMQRPFTGWIEGVERLYLADKPLKWVFIVHEGMENIHQVRDVSPGTKGVFRLVISQAEQGALLNHPDSFVAAQSFWDRFAESAIRNRIDAVCSINETIGTGPGANDQRRKTVAFDAAFAEVVAQESQGTIAPVTLLAAPGNPEHGPETEMLVPAVVATMEANGYLGPHTYFPCHPSPGVSERWMAEEGLHYHLRPMLSWYPTFASVLNIPLSDLPPLLLLELGGVGAYLRDDGRPGGFITSGMGWRDRGCLDGNLLRYLKLLTTYVKQVEVLNKDNNYLVETMAIFTQGYVEWEKFQFNEEFEQLFDLLLEN